MMILVMSQYDARGKLIRRAKYSPTLMVMWRMQIPYGTIEVTDIQRIAKEM